MAIRVAALLAGCLLFAKVSAEAAPGRFYDGLREADLCILHTTPEDCAAHADKCVTCHASVGGVDVCMETAVARKLPTKLFTCDFPPDPEPPVEPDTDCQSQTDEASCEATSKCVWCLSAAVPSACYTEAEAKRLPAAVFKCKFPSLLAQH